MRCCYFNSNSIIQENNFIFKGIQYQLFNDFTLSELVSKFNLIVLNMKTFMTFLQILNNIMLSGVVLLATSLTCLILDIQSLPQKQYCKRQSQCVFLCDKTGVVVDLTPFKRSDNKPV